MPSLDPELVGNLPTIPLLYMAFENCGTRSAVERRLHIAAARESREGRLRKPTNTDNVGKVQNKRKVMVELLGCVENPVKRKAEP